VTSPVRTAADLVALLEHRIGAGILAPGARLEPVRALAAELQLAPNTVAAAYRVLGERGLVVGEGRRGTFVAARPPLGLPGPAEEPVADGVVDLASGNPDPALLPSLAEALAAIDTSPVLYGHPPVDPQLAALFRGGFAVDGVPADHLAVVGGALDGLERVLAAHLRPGDRVAVEDPGYASVIELLHALGLRPVPVAVDRFGPDPTAVGAALGVGVAAVVITPRAHNPTGAALSADRAAELRPILAAAPDVLVVADDHAGPIAGQPYHHLIGDDRTHDRADADGETRRWATVRSMAKSLGPDLRLAAVAGDELTVRRVAGRQLVGQGWVSHLLQRVVAAMLSNPATPGRLAAASAAYAGRRAMVVDTLAAAGIEVHGRSGMNIWVPVDDEARVVAGMLRRGYAIRSGARFRLASAPGVRISVAATPEPILADAAAALVVVLDRSRPGGSTRSV